MTAPGGYKAPANPAPVSGPGALSQRTDSQPLRSLPDARYGEASDYRQQQQGAPLAKTDSPSGTAPAMSDGPASPSSQSPARTPVVPLSAPSTRPGEPVTAGVPIGPGPGPSGGGIAAEPGSITQALEPFLAGDSTGVLANLAWYLTERGL